jgi:hypothetical protein
MKQNTVIYSGPSMIDGKPIVCIAINASTNRKTGKGMLQTYILRSDVSPLDASKSGEDYSICGNCVHRGIPTDDPLKKQAIERSCYVQLFQGPSQVFKAYKNGKYPLSDKQGVIEQGNGKQIRLGSYGDPASVPTHIWDSLLSESTGHTGYTHQNTLKHIKTDYNRLMVSADSKRQAQGLHLNGKRTFRVIPIETYKAQGKASLLKSEILCPASKEAGSKTTCNDCMLCSGSTLKAKSVAIVAHGASKSLYKGS